MAGLKLTKIAKNYGSVPVIKGLDLDIVDGEFVVFVGPSGCGKSTLLRMIAGLEEITSGDLFIGERRCNEMTARNRGIAMVFQSYALYPHMSVYDNVGFALKLARVDKVERDTRIRDAARILQMEHLLKRKPAQLSGGQRQRVAIGRAIVRNPVAFLFDEPLSNLDAALRVEMRMEIAKLHRSLGTTMIYVTHDQVEAMTLADKIVVLDEGLVQQVGAPLELYHAPANLFVAGFIGAPKMNLLSVEVETADAAMVTLRSADLQPTQFALPGHTLKPGDPLILGIRPQYLAPSTETGAIAGKVQVVEHLGNETVLNLALPSGGSVVSTVPGDAAARFGDDLRLAFQPAQAHIFLPSGPRLTGTKPVH